MKLYATGPVKHDGDLLAAGEPLPDNLTDKQRKALIDAGAASATKPETDDGGNETAASAVVETAKHKATAGR